MDVFGSLATIVMFYVAIVMFYETIVMFDVTMVMFDVTVVLFDERIRGGNIDAQVHGRRGRRIHVLHHSAYVRGRESHTIQQAGCQGQCKAFRER
jgi:hypothetical protein